MARRTKEDAEKTRVQIMHAAAVLFSDRGYDRTTFEDIAKRIKRTKGAVYWHFKSKPDLLLALIVYMSDKAWTGGSLSKPTTLEELTEHFVQRARQITGSSCDSKFFLTMRSLNWKSALLAPVRERIRAIVHSPAAVMESTLMALKRERRIKGDTDIPSVSAVLLAIWYGMVENAIVKHFTVDFEQALRYGFSAVLEQIKE